MFWPFKRHPVQTMEQLAAQQPPAPCGEQTRHWQWVLIEGMPCPLCHAVQRHADEKRLAQLIADAVMAKLAANPNPSQGTN